jgi:16S rRNA (guanine527-N7)-methyltransferase
MNNIIINKASLMGVSVSDTQSKKLLEYAQLIIKWNKIYNLTAIKTLDDIINLHILDSLSIVNFIKPTSLLDIGSGAGLPSIVLAIMIPNLKVVAVDSVGKKTRFMQFVKTTLNLDNFNVINDRVENIKNTQFLQITSRAFTTIDDNIELSKHLIDKNGKFLLMKGNNWLDEKSTYQIKPYELKIPFHSDKRFLLEIKIGF